MANQVTYGRTIPKDYQSKREDYLSYAETWRLARYLVNYQLNVKSGTSRREVNSLLKRYYNNSETTIDEFDDKQEEMI